MRVSALALLARQWFHTPLITETEIYEKNRNFGEVTDVLVVRVCFEQTSLHWSGDFSEERLSFFYSTFVMIPPSPQFLTTTDLDGCVSTPRTETSRRAGLVDGGRSFLSVWDANIAPEDHDLC